MYKHFVGVASSDELKKKYKELALKFHPDKGGDVSIFQEMQAEYDKIRKSGFITYPIQNSVHKNIYDLFREGKDFYRGTYATRHANMERMKKQAEEMAAKQRAKRAAEAERAKRATNPNNREYWQEKANFDPLYSVIEELFKECLRTNRTLKYFFVEMYKIDDLSFEHFKFVKFMVMYLSSVKYEISDMTIKNAYTGYINVKNIH